VLFEPAATVKRRQPRLVDGHRPPIDFIVHFAEMLLGFRMRAAIATILYASVSTTDQDFSM
jgi:hypothetical protein